MDGRYIFLDVDGVLHSEEGDDMFEPSCMASLRRIIERTSAQIVLSSSWRVSNTATASLCDALAKHGISPPIDITEDHGFKGTRASEICAWLKACCERDQSERCGIDRALENEVQAASFSIQGQWVAIDDMDLENERSGVFYDDDAHDLASCAAAMRGHFVRKKATRGLTDALADRAIEILLSAYVLPPPPNTS